MQSDEKKRGRIRATVDHGEALDDNKGHKVAGASSDTNAFEIPFFLREREKVTDINGRGDREG